MARFRDLPEEVVVEILSWLPAESLMRFKCVRKSWYALTKNPKFVAKHLANQVQTSSINNNLCIIFKHTVLNNAGHDEIGLSLISYDNKSEAATLANGDVSDVSVNNWNLPRDEVLPYLEMMGHCNGIICFAMPDIFTTDVLLVNPAIREFRFLPESSCFSPPPHYSTRSERVIHGVGFGYDPKTDDYKVVRIVAIHEDGDYLNASYGVEVYTLSTDSWREINTVVIEVVILWTSFGYQRYFNGVIYWWAQDVNVSSSSEYAILAFDLSDEVFQKIPSPDSFSPFCSLLVLNESLTLFNYPQYSDGKFCDIWVMDEFDVNDTWSKILTIEHLQGIERPLVSWKNDELLMAGVNGQVVSYNLSTKEIKNHLPARDITGYVVAEIYVRSLLSVKGGNKID